MIRSCFISDSDTEYVLACMQRDSGLGKSELIRGLVRAACQPNGLLGAIAAQCRPVRDASLDASSQALEGSDTDCSELIIMGAT